MDGLTNRDIANIRNAYVQARELEQQIERAKACDFECSELDLRCQRAKQQCERIIQTYGPMFQPPKD